MSIKSALLTALLVSILGCSDLDRNTPSASTPSPAPESPSAAPVSEPASPAPSETSAGDPGTWKVESVCIPVERPGQTPELVKPLGDGTYVYRRPDGTLFRGTANRCRCLSGDTLISTPDGDVLIKNLKPGSPVFTREGGGEKSVKPVIRTVKVPVPDGYEIYRLTFDDGNVLLVSGGHPTADGRKISGLEAGDSLDGKGIVSVERVVYGDGFTYDILPEGETGIYWANGIALGSTLSPPPHQPLTRRE